MKKACNGCGRPFTPTSKSKGRCDQCRHQSTGSRGSTWAQRLRRERVLAAFNWRCVYCAGEATHEDHRVPLSRGGRDTEDNLVAACADCNLGKGTMTEQEFRASRA